MFNLIPITLLIMSLGGVLYIISNHLSEIREDDGGDSEFKLKAKLSEWANRLPIDSVKDQSLSITQKLLHKLRIRLLKADNYIMKVIGRISERDKAKGEGKEEKQSPEADNIRADFWDNISLPEVSLPVSKEAPEPSFPQAVKIVQVIKTELPTIKDAPAKRVYRKLKVQAAEKKAPRTRKSKIMPR